MRCSKMYFKKERIEKCICVVPKIEHEHSTGSKNRSKNPKPRYDVRALTHTQTRLEIVWFMGRRWIGWRSINLEDHLIFGKKLNTHMDFCSCTDTHRFMFKYSHMLSKQEQDALIDFNTCMCSCVFSLKLKSGVMCVCSWVVDLKIKSLLMCVTTCRKNHVGRRLVKKDDQSLVGDEKTIEIRLSSTSHKGKIWI